jgi:hypothetical protein
VALAARLRPSLLAARGPSDRGPKRVTAALGSKPFSLAAGARATVEVRLTPPAIRALARAGRIRATVTVKAADRTGVVRTAAKTVRLEAPTFRRSRAERTRPEPERG